MKKLIVIGAAVLSLSACTTTEKTTAVGAAGGAIAGAALTGTAGGAALGAVAGGAAGYLVGRVGTSDTCVYKDKYGNEYRADCP